MARFVMWGSYCDDVLERRAPHREAHLARLAQLQRDGALVTLGPTVDLAMVFGVYEAPDEAAARALVEDDPYWRHGVWTAYEVKEWTQAF